VELFLKPFRMLASFSCYCIILIIIGIYRFIRHERKHNARYFLEIDIKSTAGDDWIFSCIFVLLSIYCIFYFFNLSFISGGTAFRYGPSHNYPYILIPIPAQPNTPALATPEE